MGDDVYMTAEKWGILQALSNGRPTQRMVIKRRMRAAGYSGTTINSNWLHDLRSAGFIENPQRGFYIITESGKHALDRLVFRLSHVLNHADSA